MTQLGAAGGSHWGLECRPRGVVRGWEERLSWAGSGGVADYKGGQAGQGEEAHFGAATQKWSGDVKD